MDSVRGSSTAPSTAPSTTWRGEDTTENKNNEHEALLNTSDLDTTISDNQPIELNESHKDEIIELVVPVVEGIPSSSVNPLWTPKFIGCSSPTYASINPYKAEGRQDPQQDEGFNEPSSPLHLQPSPMISGQSAARPKTPDPESFYDNCDVLQWVLGQTDLDLDRRDALRGRNTATATITSGELMMVDAPTQQFITQSHAEDNINHGAQLHTPIPDSLVPTVVTVQLPPALIPLATEPQPGPSFTFSSSTILGTRSPSPTIKSEPDSDWEPDTQTAPRARKRGRPTVPFGSHPITPRPTPLAPGSADQRSDNEVSAQKYRRTRDLNNEASRRCRLGRKLKEEAAEEELQALTIRNQQFKRVVGQMEQKVNVLKQRIMAEISRNRGTAATLQLQQRLLQGPDQGQGQGLGQGQGQGPSQGQNNMDSMWSGQGMQGGFFEDQ